MDALDDVPLLSTLVGLTVVTLSWISGWIQDEHRCSAAWWIHIVCVQIVLTSCSILTSVPCVRKALQLENIWNTTSQPTAGRTSSIGVDTARKATRFRATCGSTWTFIGRNTSARNVESVVRTSLTWRHTCEWCIPRTSLSSARSAVEALQSRAFWHGTVGNTARSGRSNVTCARRGLRSLAVFMCISRPGCMHVSSCLNYLVLIDYNRLVLAALLMNRCLYTCWYGLARQSKNTEDESLVNSMWSKVYVTVGCPSVCLSVPSINSSNGGRQVCCWVPCGQEV